jgi:hypothetical protein
MRELFILAVLTFGIAALWLGAGWLVKVFY